jgi:cytochrome c oxidase subunit III
MTVTLIVIVAIVAVFLGWILSQSFNVRPWVAAAPTESTQDRLPTFFTAKRAGLIVFLAAISSLFALTISAYNGRMHMGFGWVSIDAPMLLWVNTAILIAGSIALHVGWRAAAREDRRRLRNTFLLGGLLTLAFIVGQIIVWQQLHAQGHLLATNPAVSFFYLLTALHAIHLIGGLVAWATTLVGIARGADMARIRSSVELCAVYWHYLLVIWAVLFGLILAT